MKFLTKIKTNQKGAILALVLVFSSIFLLFLSSLVGFITLQHKQSRQKAAYFESLEIAETGVNYARWHLAHSPDIYDFDGIYDYKDPQGDVIGSFELTITPPSGCVPAALIQATGWTNNYPKSKRTVEMRYARPALAKYAFLTNNSVWFGEEEELKGPFHSNGGIRMDGKQNSISSSAKETYICGAIHACDPPQEKPGIWGVGEGEAAGLWDFPAPVIDFDSITQDLAVLKSQSQISGIYLGQLGLGYHINFKADGTIDVYRVKKLKQKVWGYNGEEWVNEKNDIDEEDFYQNYALPGGCGPIFVEDNVWVDGIVKGRATLVAAKLPDTKNTNKSIIINGNIEQADNNSVLGLIAQKDILIPLESPDNLKIQAAMLAQKGHVFRYYYPKWSYEPYSVYAVRTKIETYGAIITNTVWTFSWVDNGGNIVSGYKTTDMGYNNNLTFNPPPYFPTSGDLEFVSWEEK